MSKVGLSVIVAIRPTYRHVEVLSQRDAILYGRTILEAERILRRTSRPTTDRQSRRNVFKSVI